MEAVGVDDMDGLTHKDIHEARIIRDAEVAESGIVRPLQQMESPKDIVAPAYRGTGGRRGATAGFEGNGGAEVGGAYATTPFDGNGAGEPRGGTFAKGSFVIR